MMTDMRNPSDRMTEQRPDLTPNLTGAELLRWYWLKDELVALAREMGISASGGKQELTALLVAALDGQPLPPQRRVSRPGAAPQLRSPLTLDTVIPVGQRCSQHLRAFLTTQVGPAFHFDAAMRDFIAAGPGRTLRDAVEHWHATRGHARPEIGAQFELNRFLRDWHAEHRGATRAEALDAWREYRSQPRPASEQGHG
jgi:hypothetical protein